MQYKIDIDFKYLGAHREGCVGAHGYRARAVWQRPYRLCLPGLRKNQLDVTGRRNRRKTFKLRAREGDASHGRAQDFNAAYFYPARRAAFARRGFRAGCGGRGGVIGQKNFRDRQTVNENYGHLKPMGFGWIRLKGAGHAGRYLFLVK